MDAKQASDRFLKRLRKLIQKEWDNYGGWLYRLDTMTIQIEDLPQLNGAGSMDIEIRIWSSAAVEGYRGKPRFATPRGCAAIDCSNSFLQHRLGRKKLYCSLACKKRAYRRRKRESPNATNDRP